MEANYQRSQCTSGNFSISLAQGDIMLKINVVVESFADHLASFFLPTCFTALRRHKTVRHVSLHNLFKFIWAHSPVRRLTRLGHTPLLESDNQQAVRNKRPVTEGSWHCSSFMHQLAAGAPPTQRNLKAHLLRAPCETGRVYSMIFVLCDLDVRKSHLLQLPAPGSASCCLHRILILKFHVTPLTVRMTSCHAFLPSTLDLQLLFRAFSEFTTFRVLPGRCEREPALETDNGGDNNSSILILYWPWPSTSCWNQVVQQLLLSLSHLPNPRRCATQNLHRFCPMK